MITKKITITNTEGLHARSATYFIQTANNYKSSLWIEIENKKANAKSLLGVLSLDITKDDEIILTADGTDEEEAVDAIASLILGGFSE